MKCPFCGNLDDRVVDSREGKAGDVIRRRRECLGCHKRFTSYERIEGVPLMVIKRDGKREIFDRGKLRSGLLKSMEKRPVSAEVIEDIVTDIESMFHDSSKREMETALIGERVMERLSSIDQVAYVRFASVYRRFEDVNQFMSELRTLLDKDGETGGRGGRSRQSPRRR